MPGSSAGTIRVVQVVTYLVVVLGESSELGTASSELVDWAIGIEAGSGISEDARQGLVKDMDEPVHGLYKNRSQFLDGL